MDKELTVSHPKHNIPKDSPAHFVKLFGEAPFNVWDRVLDSRRPACGRARGFILGLPIVPLLHVLQGPDKGRTYSTPDEPVVIGRTSDDVQLSDHSASRRHAEIVPRNGGWVLADLNSSNGTYLNGQRVVAPSPLKHGDQIKVGQTLLVFTSVEGSTVDFPSFLPPDQADLDMADSSGASSILAAFDASAESVILQPPETADAVAAWNVVYRIAESIGTMMTVDSLLERVADVLVEHLVIDQLVILMADPDLDHLSPRVIRVRGQKRGQRPKLSTSRTMINHVLAERDGVLCANALTDDRFGRDDLDDSIHRLGLRSVICVPITAYEQVHGVIHLNCSMSRHTYSQEQLRLVVAIGRLVAVSMENTRLLESRVRNERLTAMGETISYLSHHIRNILQGLQGGVDVVELGFKRGSLEAAQSGWPMVRRNLERILHLTLNMLTFSKDRQAKIETTQLNKIVLDAVSLCRGRADERAVQLVTELEEIPAVPLDPEGIHQVIQNIILNAIDVAPAGSGRVLISTTYHAQRGDVVVAISDNGLGIQSEHAGKIFEAFHSTKGHSGTGLGLAAARKLVLELKGRIEVESPIEGGAVFRVCLPTEQVRLADEDDTLGLGDH